MSERIASGYRRLIEVRVLHHYWLDEGSVGFDDLPADTRDARLLKYDVRPFLSIAPTPSSDTLIKNLRCIYRDTALGFVVAAPNDLVVPGDAHFDFIVKVQDASFYNYTSLTIRPQKIYELYYAPEDKIYRYKENVPLFSNVTGAFRGPQADPIFFLSKEFSAMTASDQAEYLVQSGNALMQLTSDQPGAATQQLGAQLSNMPVFVNQGDVPVIVPPAGLVGAPERGVLLSSEMPDDLFAFMNLSASAARAGGPDFSLIDGNGNTRMPNPIFEIRFRNRSTTWSYFDKTNRTPVFTEPAPLPLTYFGNAGARQKPSEGPVTIVQTGPRITNLVSEIFV